jgi:peptidoglycan/LPS O-acetylase OafA/YrhL
MPTLLPLRLGLFLCGMLSAVALQTNGSRYQQPAAAFVCITIAVFHNKWFAGAVTGFLLWEWLTERTDAPRPLAMATKWGRSLMCSTPVKFIADCSYGVYLWHILVQLLAMRLLQDAGAFTDQAPLTRYFLLVGISLPIVYLLAWVTHRMVELPGIKLGKHYLAKGSKSQPQK